MVARTTTAAFVYAALVYGGVLAFVHVMYSRMAVVSDALLLLIVFVGLYGVAGAIIGFGCGLVGTVARARLETVVAAAIAAVNLVFWLPFATYGVTYDEIPFGTSVGVAGMVFALLVRALVVVAVVVAIAMLTRLVFVRVVRWSRVAVIAGVLVVIAVVAAALTAADGARTRAASATAPAITRVDTGYTVVLIGIDGADWRVIRPLLDAGGLPSFARLMLEGASGPLATIAAANSAVMWASAYTGRTPAEHRVRDFYRVVLRGMRGPGFFPVHRTFAIEVAGALERLGLAERRVVDRKDLAAPTLWEIADAAGVSTGVVDNYLFGYPLFRPVQPSSFFVAYGFGYLKPETEHWAKDYVEPAELAPQLLPLVPKGDLYWQSAALLRILDGRPRPDVVSLYTHEPDSRQHLFWKWWEPDVYLDAAPDDVARFADVIPSVYRDIDAFLGELLARLDDRTVLIVVSDHGHSPTLLKHGSHTEHRHGPPGIVIMHGGPVRAGATLDGAHLYDVLPTVLHLVGLPVARDGAGRVLDEAFVDEFVASRPARSIASYDGMHAAAPTSPLARPAEWNAEQIEKLRALGYLR